MAPWTACTLLDIVALVTVHAHHRSARAAWGIGLVCLVLLGADLILLALDWKAIDAPATAQFQYFLQAPLVGVLGVLIATRRPRNPIGWLLLSIAAFAVIYLLADLVTIRGLLTGAKPQGWVGWPAVVFGTIGTPGAGALLVAYVILYFPNGRLPGPHWRWAAWGVFAGGAALTMSSLLATRPIQPSPLLPSVPNPVSVAALDGLTNDNSPVFLVAPILLCGLLGATTLVRFRRSRGAERRELRWFACVVIVALVLVGIGSVASPAGSAGFFGIAVLLPATIGLAVMKYGLYDIDVFISRTIVYGSLAVFIGAVYVGIAVGMGTLIGQGGQSNLALQILATGIVAVGFQPVRERVQRFANRLVYGTRATPYEVLARFSERAAESYGGDEVLPRMAQVLAEGTSAELAEVWLHSGRGLRRAAAFPPAAPTPAPVEGDSGLPTAVSASARTVEVRHQGELLGALAVTKRRGESLTATEVKLMDDLAHQAGLVLKNVGLTADLRARLDDLRASRQRLVAAQDDERRKLERNLHDGAQQHLVAIKVKLGMVEMLAGRDPEKALATVVALKSDADEALDTLRDLARGIYPPLLAEQGLARALQSQARKTALPVHVDADGIGRYPQETEAALYFCTLEALQNVQKYASASKITVRLRDEGNRLLVEVSDDGRGFDLTAVTRGAGLTNMEDRLDALGGRLQIDSSPGRGTTLRATVPVSHAEAAAAVRL